MNRLIKILSCALCCALLLIFAAAGRAQGYSRYSMMFFDVFDTVITLTGFAESQEVFSAAAQDTQKLLTHYHQLFDQYHEYPDTVNLCTLNKTAAGAPVAVSQELFDFLSWCVDLQEQYGSDHTNIALGKVLQLWHEAREEGIADPAHARLPDEEALRAASAHTDIHALVLGRAQTGISAF
jgi:thiamine biosynthesis lipoprotein